jgi:hypothetical protein
MEPARRNSCCNKLVQRIECAPSASADDEVGKLRRIGTERRRDSLYTFDRYEAGDQRRGCAAAQSIAQERSDLLLWLTEQNSDGDWHVIFRAYQSA